MPPFHRRIPRVNRAIAAGVRRRMGKKPGFDGASHLVTCVVRSRRGAGGAARIRAIRIDLRRATTASAGRCAEQAAEPDTATTTALLFGAR